LTGWASPQKPFVSIATKGLLCPETEDVKLPPRLQLPGAPQDSAAGGSGLPVSAAARGSSVAVSQTPFFSVVTYVSMLPLVAA
jgi:hypothetical protein